MAHLRALCVRLCSWGAGEELWLNGSFLTEKIDPKDTDVVLVIEEHFQDHATPEQLELLKWWDDSNEPRELFRCDNFSLPKIPVGDSDHQVYLRYEAYWKGLFGTSRDGEPKGIGRILLPDGCV